MARTFLPRRARHGFTLVEMLTVIIIIGLLAALLLVALNAGRKTARNAAVKMQLTDLLQKLEVYKQEYGEYPPDFVGCASSDANIRAAARQVVLRHLRKRFPRVTISGATVDAQYDSFIAAIANATGILPANLVNMTVSEALVFWLAGLPESATVWNQLTGFSANAANPIQSKNVSNSRTPIFFEFDQKLLFQADPNAVRLPSFGALSAAGGTGPVAFCYFRPSVNPYVPDTNGNPTPSWYIVGLDGMPTTARPYVDSATLSANLLQLRWMDQGKPQIVAAGLDGGFGALNNPPNTNDPLHYLPPLFPSGANFAPESSGAQHIDNITTFTEKATLEDEVK